MLFIYFSVIIWYNLYCIKYFDGGEIMYKNKKIFISREFTGKSREIETSAPLTLRFYYVVLTEYSKLCYNLL